jgi:outer membrane protein assembly factor BamC
MNQHIRTATNYFGMLMLTGMVGCSSIGSMLDADRIDYKSAASKKSVNKLEIPPDLTQLQRDSRYSIPEAASGTITASDYNSQQGVRIAKDAVVVAPKEMASVRIERAGGQRWLVVNKTPQELWPQIKDFWQDSGFLLNVESPETGVMETDWAENRAKIPQDFIRSSIGKVLDSLYSTGERDKFRTRLERAADGSTEIYISHRGAQEELVGTNKDSTVWTARPSDPELEAEFLSRLMVRLSADKERAKAASLSPAAPQQSSANLIKGENGSVIEANEGFDRLWRRVGLALDRVGFTVEDRDRSQGLYFVRYVDQGSEAQDKSAAAEKGFFSKLFSSKDDKEKTAQRYRVLVKAVGTKSQVTVLGNDGKPEKSAIGDKILSLLHAQLK